MSEGGVCASGRGAHPLSVIPPIWPRLRSWSAWYGRSGCPPLESRIGRSELLLLSCRLRKDCSVPKTYVVGHERKSWPHPSLLTASSPWASRRGRARIDTRRRLSSIHLDLSVRAAVFSVPAQAYGGGG